MKGFNKTEAAEISGLPIRSVQYYSERGVVVPEIDPGEGKGATRIYSEKNLVELSFIRVLRVYGVSFPVVKKALFSFRNAIANWHKHIGQTHYLYFHSGNKGIGFNRDSLIDEHIIEEACLIVDLGKIITRVNDAL